MIELAVVGSSLVCVRKHLIRLVYQQCTPRSFGIARIPIRVITLHQAPVSSPDDLWACVRADLQYFVMIHPESFVRLTAISQAPRGLAPRLYSIELGENRGRPIAFPKPKFPGSCRQDDICIVSDMGIDLVTPYYFLVLVFPNTKLQNSPILGFYFPFTVGMKVNRCRQPGRLPFTDEMFFSDGVPTRAPGKAESRHQQATDLKCPT